MIDFSHITLRRPDDSFLLHDFSLSIAKGELVLLLGESGSGKSTLIRMLTGELRADEGSVTIASTNIFTLRPKQVSEHRRTIGIVSEELQLLNDRTLEENLELPLEISGMPAKRRAERLDAICKRFNLNPLRSTYPSELAMSERQLVAIARAVIGEPSVLVADEPAAHLGEKAAKEIALALEHEGIRGMTMIIATRNERFAAMFSNARIVRLPQM